MTSKKQTKKGKTIYANTDIGRLRAVLPETGNEVCISRVGGGILGWYKIGRFQGGKVTANTLAKLFARENWNTL